MKQTVERSSEQTRESVEVQKVNTATQEARGNINLELLQAGAEKETRQTRKGYAGTNNNNQHFRNPRKRL